MDKGIKTIVQALIDVEMEEIRKSPRVSVEEGTKCPFCGYTGEDWVIHDGWIVCPLCGSN